MRAILLTLQFLLFSGFAFADCNPESLLQAAAGQWAGQGAGEQTTFEGKLSGPSQPWSFLAGKITGLNGFNYQVLVAKNRSVATGLSNYSLKLTELNRNVSFDFMLTDCVANKGLLIFSRVKSESRTPVEIRTVDMFQLTISGAKLRIAFEGADVYCSDANSTTKLCGSGAYSFRDLNKKL